MEILIAPCIFIALIGIFIGIISTKYDWAVQTLIGSAGVTILFFISSLIFNNFWEFTLMFACFPIPGIIIVSAISYSENKKNKAKEDAEKEERKRLLREYDLLENKKAQPLLESIKDNSYYIGDKCISLSARKGYNKFLIAGAYYQNLPASMIGKFNGYVTTEPWNEHDKYAIAVYTDADVQLGYIPKNNRRLHSYILENDDKVHAYGYIGCNDDGGMYGEVCVETDKALVTKRNKPYNVD